MPVIEFRKDIGGCSAFLSTWSVMLFPREKSKREQWLASGVVMGKAGGDGSIDVNEWAEQIYSLPQAPKRAWDNAAERIPRAGLSGWIFLYLLILARHQPQLCRLDCAIELVEEFNGLEKGKQPSESLLRKVWAEFRPVSHLWAIYNYYAGTRQFASDDASWLSRLAESEGYRRTAKEQEFMKTNDMWRAPPGVEPVTMEAPPLPDEMNQFVTTRFLHLLD